MRSILSIVMIVAVVAGFALFIVPHYNNVKTLRAQAADYNQILINAKTLQQERNRLVQKYNGFDQNQLSKLNAMLPKNPENVKLILELDGIASQYGMALQNVKIDTGDTTQTARPGTVTNTDTGTLAITFSMTGPYNGFTQFLRAMQTSLRVIDIDKLSFSAVEDKSNYQYTVGIKTYWLK